MAADYDTVIVGGGPAGLCCAIELAKAGKEVLVLEMQKTPDHHKVCAGGLSRRCVAQLGNPETDGEFHSMLITFPGKEVKIHSRKPMMFTIRRAALHKFLSDRAKDAGVTLMYGEAASEASREKVRTAGGEEFSFRHLVGADGSKSIVRKLVGLDEKESLLAFHYETTKEFDIPVLGFDASFFGGAYSWVFPHAEGASIGCGYDLLQRKSTFPSRLQVRENFEKWASGLIGNKEKRFEAHTINYGYRGVEFGNVFLAGDAAGLASPLTGEGIRQAVVSGIEIARKILNPSYGMPKLRNRVLLHNLHLGSMKVLTYSRSSMEMLLPLAELSMRSPIGPKAIRGLLR